MKIALVGDTLFHQGAEYVLATLARGFEQGGDEVDIILSHRQIELQRLHPEWKPFEVSSRCNIHIGGYSRGRSSVLALRKLIMNGRYDVVMSHASPYSIPLACACMWMRKRPILIHVEHSSLIGVDVHGNIVQGRKWCGIWTFIKRMIMRRFDAQFAVSTGTADGINRCSGYPRDKIFVVYNPVVDEEFYRKVLQRPSHPWLLDKSVPVLVAAGAFQPMKNHIMLIRAFAEVVRKRRAKLIIFGDGPLRAQYIDLIADLSLNDFVSLPGFTDNLPSEIRNADGYVISSTVESFSIVCVEALASGTPVVSTDCPYGPRELLRGGEYGMLVKNDDIIEMADALVDLLDGKFVKPTEEMVAAYTVPAIVERYKNAVRMVMERSKA